VEQHLDSAQNRKLVERFLASIPTEKR